MDGMLSCTVVTDRATEGDGLATALFVLGVKGARDYCRRHGKVEAILVPAPPAGGDVKAVRIGGAT